MQLKEVRKELKSHLRERMNPRIRNYVEPFTVLHSYTMQTLYIAAIVMMFSLTLFLFFSGKMLLIDMHITLYVMLISGIVVTLTLVVEMLMGVHTHYMYGKIACLFAGLSVVIEAVVSLIALHTSDYTYYNIYNYNMLGLIIMFGLTMIFVVVQFTHGKKSPD